MNRRADMLNSEADISDLVRQTQAGSRDAFDCLVKRYQVCAMRTAVCVLADSDEAAEAVQEGFVTAYLKINKLKDPLKFSSWLLRIVVNCAIDRQKSAIRRNRLTQTLHALPDAAASCHEDAVQGEELKAAIQAAMAKLTKVQMRAVALFGIEDLSHQEVARILGCSAQAARWHVYQARKKLKVLLKEYIE